MHPLFGKASGLTETIIAAAIEVHRRIGPGLIESIYESCLLKELELRGLLCASQKIVVIEYKGFVREEPLRFDVMVEKCVLVETKAVQSVLPIHKAQLLRRHLINRRSRGAVDFRLGQGVDEGAYPRRSATEEQRNPSRKAAPSAGQEHFAASGGVARS